MIAPFDPELHCVDTVTRLGSGTAEQELSVSDFGLVRDGAVRQRVPAAWRPRIAEIIRALNAGDHSLDGVDGARHLDGSSPESVRGALRLAGGLDEPDDRSWERSVATWGEWDGDEWWEVYVELDTVDPAGRDLVLHLLVTVLDSDHYLMEVSGIYVP